MHYIPGAGFVKSPMFRPRSYSPTYFRRSYTYDDDPLIYPVHIPRKNFIDTSAEESYLRTHVNKELYFSGAALEDTFDLASQSRNRDQQLLSKANRAIVNTQLHSSPRYAVVSRRATRSQSVPPSDLHRKVVKEAALVGSKVDIVLPEKRRPKSVYAQSKMRQIRKEEREQVPDESTEGLKAHRPFAHGYRHWRYFV
ncbi:hypothetical protein CHS0354_018927 [Potamilus streckersoni]|uniref:Uncharacterized protein n=1 Tax=Potamilus streckersoni TaxID=2493646 RepID=A0AAE0RN60_9BIVA|nr:hypothetical protein CHS0354_018927 [Potamilus streckersoni]